MSAKKHKRKVKHTSHHPKQTKKSSFLSLHPKMFLVISFLLIITGILLLTIGYVSTAKVGLSMIILFFGLALGLFANSALPKSKAIMK